MYLIEMRGGSRGSPRQLYDTLLTNPRVRRGAAVLGCEAKRFYASRSDATAHMLTLPAGSRAGLVAYLCPGCGGWHLGHERRKKGKR